MGRGHVRLFLLGDIFGHLLFLLQFSTISDGSINDLIHQNTSRNNQSFQNVHLMKSISRLLNSGLGSFTILLNSYSELFAYLCSRRLLLCDHFQQSYLYSYIYKREIHGYTGAQCLNSPDYQNFDYLTRYLQRILQFTSLKGAVEMSTCLNLYLQFGAQTNISSLLQGIIFSLIVIQSSPKKYLISQMLNFYVIFCRVNGRVFMKVLLSKGCNLLTLLSLMINQAQQSLMVHLRKISFWLSYCMSTDWKYCLISESNRSYRIHIYPFRSLSNFFLKCL